MKMNVKYVLKELLHHTKNPNFGALKMNISNHIISQNIQPKSFGLIVIKKNVVIVFTRQ
jgi:hypothetical protein